MNKGQLIKELKFKAIRSSGAGGQHVNKVSSKIELSFSIKNSLGLTENEKVLLLNKLNNRISKNGKFILFCDESRSQHKNKDLVIKRFLELISANIIKPKVRRASKPSRSSILRKKQNKQNQSLKKSFRKKVIV